MDIIENVKHGMVFYVFGIFMLILITSSNSIGNNLPFSASIMEIIVIATPFFLMGFFDKMLD